MLANYKIPIILLYKSNHYSTVFFDDPLEYNDEEEEDDETEYEPYYDDKDKNQENDEGKMDEDEPGDQEDAEDESRMSDISNGSTTDPDPAHSTDSSPQQRRPHSELAAIDSVRSRLWCCYQGNFSICLSGILF